MCRFGSGNWFCSCIFAHFAEAGEWQSKRVYAPAREECNNYDLFSVSDWSRWFAISSLLAICSLNFSFMGGIAKK